MLQTFFNLPQGRNLTQQSCFRKRIDVDLDDMTRFIAIVIGIVLLQHQDILDYWSKYVMLRTLLFGNTMTKNKISCWSRHCFTWITMTIKCPVDKIDMIQSSKNAECMYWSLSRKVLGTLLPWWKYCHWWRNDSMGR